MFAANAGDPDQAKACVAATIERFGRIDILVNNAATNPYFGPTLDIDVRKFDKTVEVNLRGPLVWTQEVVAASMREHGGAIINIASVGGLSVETSLGVYNAHQGRAHPPHPDVGGRAGARACGSTPSPPGW